jgi:hypothetical protein
MARAADHLSEPPVEFIADGMTDHERAVSLAAWFDEFDHRPKLELHTRAADTLAELRAEDEV